MKKIPDDVLAELDRAEKNGNAVKLVGQLDRKLYAAVNKVLEAAGGKWNRKAQAHLFEGDAAERLDTIILTGSYETPKQDFGQFDTPKAVVDIVIGYAQIGDGDHVLEPSAGFGNIALAVLDAAPSVKLLAIELDEPRASSLKRLVANRAVVCERADFLKHLPASEFDRVVMNPPFAKGADIAHVKHAYHFLKPGGRLVAIMPPSWTFRTDRRYIEFREWAKGLYANWHPLPDGSFEESGTNVSTGVLVLDKPA